MRKFCVSEWIYILLFAWMSRNWLLETGAISEVLMTATEFLDIQATIQCRNTLKRYSGMKLINKYSQHRSIILPVWPYAWVFVYELSGCELESCCCQLNFRYRACFEQGVIWHSDYYRVKIHSETITTLLKLICPKRLFYWHFS